MGRKNTDDQQQYQPYKQSAFQDAILGLAIDVRIKGTWQAEPANMDAFRLPGTHMPDSTSRISIKRELQKKME